MSKSFGSYEPNVYIDYPPGTIVRVDLSHLMIKPHLDRFFYNLKPLEGETGIVLEPVVDRIYFKVYLPSIEEEYEIPYYLLKIIHSTYQIF